MSDVPRPLRVVAHPPIDDPAEHFLVASRLSPLVSESSSGMHSLELATQAGALGRFGEPTGFDWRDAGVDLPRPRLGTAPVADALRARRSAQSFAPGGIALDELAVILGESVGVTQEHGRGSPSPGALMPLDCVVAVAEVDGLEPGFYGYHPFAHRLVRLGIDAAPRAWLGEALVHQALAADSGCHVLLTASFDRVRVKYGQRGVRFALLEAGHVAQSMLLVAASLGLASCPVGGYLDDVVDRTLGLDGLTSTVVHGLAIGRAP